MQFNNYTHTQTHIRARTRFSLNVENEQGDVGRDGQTCLVRPDSQARTGTGKY